MFYKWQRGGSSCYLTGATGTESVVRGAVAAVLLLHCALLTLPAYTIVVQMGSQHSKFIIPPELQMQLKAALNRARARAGVPVTIPEEEPAVRKTSIVAQLTTKWRAIAKDVRPYLEAAKPAPGRCSADADAPLAHTSKSLWRWCPCCTLPAPVRHEVEWKLRR